MKQVTQDEWADFSSDYRCVATESLCEGVTYMNLNHHQTKELVSQVLYFSNGAKEYWINEECTAPKTGLLGTRRCEHLCSEIFRPLD